MSNIRILIFCLYGTTFLSVTKAFSQDKTPFLTRGNGVNTVANVVSAKPLETLVVGNILGKTISVKDGEGRIYFSAASPTDMISFRVGGSLGMHTISITNKKKQTQEIRFSVDATTAINDRTGRYSDMFKLFYTGMNSNDTGSVMWNGKKYRFYVPWGLDHCHTMKGLKYFLGYGGEFVDLMRAVQRNDGMIYSFVQYQSNVDYFKTRDSISGYTKKIGDRYFIRQPTENHPEYIFVNTVYQWWKASGDDDWMKGNLSAAANALNYALNDPARFSKRFQLLKRVYTIDSWDFQVEDEYTPDIGLTNTMIIDPEKSKFGVFFGDNTGYIAACRELAEMYEAAGMKREAEQFRSRSIEFKDRLDKLAWNGKFYTHYIDEDPTVKRNLGVDEKHQLAQSNAYTLNRGLPRNQSKAIIESYLGLKKSLPIGSPGEWYAIYPPFERGFGIHGSKWQYMNGGVGGHVAGELALGAFENGYEQYGADILERLYDLGKKYDNKIWFAYTGSIPPPPPAPVFRTVDLSRLANMDHWDQGAPGVFSWMNSKRAGDDLRKLPVGEHQLAGIKFNVIDPARNGRKSVVAVSRQKGFAPQVDIPINDTTTAIYLLHTSSKPTSENVSGAITISYEDGTSATRYMLMGKHLTYWWFSELKTDRSGIAWYGDNQVSRGVGLSWCAIDNPNPKKKISKITLHAAQDNTIYTVFAISLSNQPHYIPVSPTSFGGPDNWAAATAMAGLVEGLAGVRESSSSQAYRNPILSPRWIETRTDSVETIIRYAPSSGYVAYRYTTDTGKRRIQITVTGSGEKINGHFLLPKGISSPRRVTIDGKETAYTKSVVEGSSYVDVVLPLPAVQSILIEY